MEHHWIELTVDASRMRVLLRLPAARTETGDAAVPGVVVCMHAPGIDAFMTDIAARLAAAGFAVAMPDLYHRQDPEDGSGPLQRMARLRDDELFRDLAAATAALRMSPGVAARAISVVGFCMGGRIAWLQAARDATLQCGVCFYAGSIDTAWSDAGDARTPLQWGANIRAPMLGIFGAEDTNPGPGHMAAMREVLEHTGVPHELHAYAGCGHAFLNFERPSYREAEAQHAWARCIDWLRRHGAAPAS